MRAPAESASAGTTGASSCSAEVHNTIVTSSLRIQTRALESDAAAVHAMEADAGALKTAFAQCCHIMHVTEIYHDTV